MKKLLLISLICTLSPLGHALPEDTNNAVCVGIKNNTISFRTACTVTSGGGGGVMATDITFNNTTHHVIRDGSQEVEQDTLDDKPYTTYLRDGQFKKTTLENAKKYFCYKTTDRKLEFCVSNIGEPLAVQETQQTVSAPSALEATAQVANQAVLQAQQNSNSTQLQAYRNVCAQHEPADKQSICMACLTKPVPPKNPQEMQSCMGESPVTQVLSPLTNGLRHMFRLPPVSQ